MPTIYTHGIVGLGAAGVIFPRCWSWLFWILSGFLPMIPDFDAFSPAAYGTPFGHRGFTHSFLFALAIGAEMGIGPAEVERGLEQCKPARMRLQLWEIKGVRVLDDAYNANADSVVAALRTLQELPYKGRRLAVLGDMAELGAHSQAAHEEIGRLAAELGVGQLFAVGKMASVVARGARGAGLDRVIEFPDVEAAAAAVKRFIKKGDVLLLKASRATRLERISEVLRATNGGQRSEVGEHSRPAPDLRSPTSDLRLRTPNRRKD